MTPSATNAEIPGELKFRNTLAEALGEVLPLLVFGVVPWRVQIRQYSCSLETAVPPSPR